MWSIGHRNAQGLALAPNGIIYSSEHGPNNDDELNILQAGNFGWPNVQGFCDNQWVDEYYAEDLTNNYSESDYCLDNDVIEPLWSSGSSTIAPSDIIWYDHPSIPEFQNSLLMTVLKGKKLVRFTFNEAGDTIESETDFFNNEWGRLRDICVSPDGKIYLATNGNSWPSQGPNEIIELHNADYTSIVENEISGLRPFPNPISQTGILNLPTSELPYLLEIVNVQGQVVYSERMTENTLQLNGMFASGLYVIKVTNTIEKLIIE